MNDIWKKLQELYHLNPGLFGFLLFVDLCIVMFLIKIFLL